MLATMAFSAAFLFLGVADLASFIAADFTLLDEPDVRLVALRFVLRLTVVLRRVAARLVVFLRLNNMIIKY